MPMESANSPATLRKTMRRVRLEKLCVMKNCQARGTQPMMCGKSARLHWRSLNGDLAVGLRVVLIRGVSPHLGPCDFCGSIEHVVCRVSTMPAFCKHQTPLVPHVSRPVRGHGSMSMTRLRA